MNINNILSTLLEIFIYSGIVQGIYSTFILSQKRLRNPANHFLAILLVILSFSILHSAFIIPYFHSFHQTTFYIREPFILLIVPLIWFYLKKLNEPSFHFARIHLLHFLPFVIVMSFSVVSVVRHARYYNNIIESHALFFNIFLYICALAQFAFYIAYIFRIIRNIKNKAQNEFSNTENVDPSWLQVFLLTFLTVFILLTIMMVIAIHKLNLEYFNKLVTVIFTCIIYVLGYKGLFQQSIPTIISDNPEQIKQPHTKTKIENLVDESQLLKLHDFVKDRKPYCNPELTLTSLAEQLAMSRNQLSELINTGTGCNFYEFVNNYRVDEVKQLMVNPKYKDYTLLALAFEAGFPSKSTFNSIFKKSTGTTPSDYRNRL